ncbi:hypothetical protein K501DRAFT_315043 [Backusella circina FSU 941]|nr:hypothetical protein K501DRAFT_315043 [Backusella circina FSU 941]
MTKQVVYTNLPSLEDIISRKSRPPVCLYNLYIVMRDRLEYEELLDFYLDIKQYEQLWKHFIKDIRKHNKHLEKDIADISYYSLSSSLSSQNSGADPKRIKELIGYCQRIHLRYLELGAPKEVRQLPLKLKLDLCRVLQGKPYVGDPMVFADAKAFCLAFMQQHVYPKFIKVKAYENVTLEQKLLRVVLSLLCLLCALTGSLCFIFLGYPQWGVRFWIFIPFWLGIHNLLVFLTGVDPIWALAFNISETTTFHFNSIIEHQVKMILRKRSFISLFIGLFISFICTIIFCAIPPHTL